MKKLYVILSLLLIGVLSPAFSQRLTDIPFGEGPTLTKQPTKFPGIGFSVVIPLQKFVRKKGGSTPLGVPTQTNDVAYVYDPDCSCFVIPGSEVKAPKNEGFGNPADAAGGTYPTDPNAPPRPTFPGDLGGAPGEDRPKPRFTNDPLCKTLQNMWQSSLDFDGNPRIEIMALITNLGTLILPTAGKDCNGVYHSNSVSSSYSDYLGSFLTIVDASGNSSQVYVLCDGTRVEVFAAVHTHPSTSIGNPFQPSPSDQIFARTHPGMDNFILGKEGVAKYHPDGECEEPSATTCN